MRALIIIVVLSMEACNTVERDDSVEPGKDLLVLPDQFTYKGKNPEFGNKDNLEIIMRWNNMRSQLDHNIENMIADSLTIHFDDGSESVMTKTSAVEYFEKLYRGFKTQTVTMNAAIPVHYSDIDHDWVYSWVHKQVESNEGQIFESYLHEDFRIKEGKIREIYQFKRVAAHN